MEVEFFSKVEKTDYCWNWIGSKKQYNYGIFWNGKKRVLASRWSWEYHNQACIAKGVYCLHKCDNPACVNPTHLYLGTQKNNMQDMVARGRKPSRVGERNGRSKLTENQVKNIRSLYCSGKYSKVDLGKMFKITAEQIGHIVNNKQWKINENQRKITQK